MNTLNQLLITYNNCLKLLMSGIPNSAEEANKQPTETLTQQGGQTASNVPGQQYQQYMLYLDPQSQQWSIHPYYANIIVNQVEIVEALEEVVNQKWSQEQTNAYLGFLGTIKGYIYSYVYNLQVQYYEEYVAAIQYYTSINPLGSELYQKQLQYMQKKLSGHDFKQDKKKNKDPNAPKQQPKVKQVKEVQEKEKVVVRSGDPEINIQKLFGTDWDPSKYLSTSFLAKENINIVFIGHVDSGKSTLTGNIMKQLKEVDQQELLRIKQNAQSNKMEAWEQAGISDVIPEEQVDGKTREFAKLNFSLTNKRFTLFDAPGHKNYVPNMIMGACQADVAVLIISAKEGEFQSGFEKEGQTKEHAMLAKALGVVELIAIVTKMGTVDWNEKRFQLIKEQVNPFLENSCGFHKVAFIPLDSINNINVHSRIQNSWYNGPCFTQYLDNIILPERKPLGPLRIPVIDKFKDVGNLFVYGKIESGTIIEDQTVTVLPQRLQMVIKEIFNAKDERMAFACAGENVKIKVKNVQENDISRGDMICNNLNYCQQSAQFKANITILELPEQKKLISSGYECVMHMHAIAVQISISKVEAKIQKDTGKKVAIGFLKTGEKGICQIKVERPVCLEKHEFMPGLGRFVLRDEGKTIGFGQIIGIKPAKTLLKQQKQQLTATEKIQAKTEQGKEVPSKQSKTTVISSV